MAAVLAAELLDAQGQLVFAQLLRHLPLSTFRRCAVHYDGEHKVKSFSCLDQYLCMAFAQVTYRESLRDIQACLRAQSSKLCHLGTRGSIARNTAGERHCHASFAQRLIRLARDLYADEPFGVDLAEMEPDWELVALSPQLLSVIDVHSWVG